MTTEIAAPLVAEADSAARRRPNAPVDPGPGAAPIVPASCAGW